MKINCIPLHTYHVLVCAAAFIFTSGCNSFMNLDRRPELAQRPYNNQEKLWRNIIHKSYPKWREPVTPVETRGNRSTQSPAEATASGSAAKSVDNHVQPVKKDAPSNPAVSRSVLGHQISPDVGDSNSPEDLPPAVFDFAPNQSIPPSETEPFRIVPDSGALSGGQTPGLNQLRRYTVKKGETLIDIARKIYGDQSAWKRIYDVNRDILEDPNRVKPGISLKLP